MNDKYNELLRDLSLRSIREYDCTSEDVLAFRRKTDKWKGITISLGNMCNGYPFSLGGLNFHNSECAYIAGAYAGNDPECMRIQNLISAERNGLKCKRIYRNREEFTRYIRKDWNEYNVQYMMYVVWQKVLQNEDFANLLRKIPAGSHVVENSTFQKGITANFWGASNPGLAALKKADGKKAARGVYDKGCYTGYNVMGKIIKLCSISLLYGEEPPVDFELLNRKKLFINGSLHKFKAAEYDDDSMAFIVNARGN